MMRVFGFAVLAVIAACTRYPAPDRFLGYRGIEPPAGDRFVICHGYGCTYRTPVVFNDEDWAAVLAPLATPAGDAPDERTRIGLALARFEEIVGRKTGTETDVGGLTFRTAGDPTQLDCMDETTNTTTYLTLLQTRGVLRWHRVSRPASRGVFLDGRWYHETAVLMEQAGGAEFAVDSWFEDNGKPPHILPLDQWGLSWSYS